MRYFWIIIASIILLSFTHCKNNVSENPISETFYKNNKDSFLKSDLVKFNYNPRMNFAYGDIDSTTFYRVLVRPDSTLRIMGFQSFCKIFKIEMDTPLLSDIYFRKYETDRYIIRITNEEADVEKLIFKQKSTQNIVDYFFKLERLIEEYRILEINKHPIVNTIKIVFSDHDYLIYKPDTLVFKDKKNTTFMNHLFNNGKELDKNWFQFSEKIDTDYY